MWVKKIIYMSVKVFCDYKYTNVEGAIKNIYGIKAFILHLF